MQTIKARTALTPEGWRKNVAVTIDARGVIDAVVEDHGQSGVDVDVLLPAMSNLHSHSFQRALAGLTEHPGEDAGDDDFWTWRRAMYGIVDRLEPEDIYAIAAQVQMEMLEAGYAAIGEFHYIHHNRGGALYEDPALLSKRIFSAAADTGIGLTHLPVLYMRGGMNDEPLTDAQKRFGSSEETYGKIFAGLQDVLKDSPSDFRLGVAPHSLRAVNKSGIDFVCALAGDNPVHIHVAEQTAEVEAVEAAYGLRPVRWLLESYSIDKNWCFVHATHMNKNEVRDLAGSGAVAGICPLTEANLGDGFFDGPEYLNIDGAFGVGSDSNFRISASEELRMLEYSQRLTDRKRLVLATGGKSVGRTLYEGAARGGAQALGRNAGQIAPGFLADLTALNTDNDVLYATEGDAILDSWIFSGDDHVVEHVWSAGRHVVDGGRHIGKKTISDNFRSSISKLRSAL